MNVAVSGSASADGVVTRREDDGRYAFVEISCRVDAELDPAPRGSELEELIARAERGCFIAASLSAKPQYIWFVNGSEVA